ncbi:PQQ-dependent sugar dehydrogenase [Rubrivirga sp. IMCC45206]|uniref:PQQ-dependent sugar dehydrogenase n=1 Tax=Rubrivirga sp. IMCC45206 TaxID=3391614 RepID=UPI00399014C2
MPFWKPARLFPRPLGLAVAAVLLASAGAGASVVLSEFGVWPYPALQQGVDAATRRTRPPERVLPTQLLDFDLLQVGYGFPQTSRQAGAFARMPGALLLMVNGTLSVLDPETLARRLLPVAFPDNGREALEALPAPDGPPAHVRYAWHRYHDLEYEPPYLYLSYSQFYPDARCVTSVVARLRIEGPVAQLRAGADDWETVLETSPCLLFRGGPEPYKGHQAGGRLERSGDGALFWTVGDYGYDGLDAPPVSQNPASDYGRIWRIDLATGASTVHSTGHRNPQGLTRTADGALWSTEHGPQGGDELNHVEAGRDYGWPQATYGTDYGSSVWPGAIATGRHEGFAKPAWSWVPSIAPSELDEVEGIDPLWDGDLLIGSLNARSLVRARLDGSRVVTMETIPLGDRVRDMLMYRGRIYLYSDNAEVIRLTPRRRPAGLQGGAPAMSREAAGEIGRCRTCHGQSTNGAAPGLCGVEGRPVGQAPGASDALRRAGGVWDRDRLVAFLADTEAGIPGTGMPQVTIPDPAVRAEVVDRLDTLCR